MDAWEAPLMASTRLTLISMLMREACLMAYHTYRAHLLSRFERKGDKIKPKTEQNTERVIQLFWRSMFKVRTNVVPFLMVPPAVLLGIGLSLCRHQGHADLLWVRAVPSPWKPWSPGRFPSWCLVFVVIRNSSVLVSGGRKGAERDDQGGCCFRHVPESLRPLISWTLSNSGTNTTLIPRNTC